MLFRFLFLLSMFCSAAATAQPNWEIAKDKNNIKVYTRKEATSKFKQIKVVATINGTIDKLLKVMMDAGSNKEWVFNTANSYIIKRISPFESISYTETNVPWPASNRDIPLHMQLIPDAKANTLKIIANGLPNAIPHKQGIVRIPYFNSRWDVKFDGKNTLNIVYYLEMDSGGAVPAWLVNMFIAKGPYETFSGLAKMMK